MLEIIMKIDNRHSFIVDSSGQIYYYDLSVEAVMDLYLRPLLISFESINCSSKKILGSRKYKRPISYYTSEGLNILVPTTSMRKPKCCWISLNYFTSHTLDEFNELTKLNLTGFQWSQMITSAITYRNMFNLDISLPPIGTLLTRDELLNIVKDCN